MMNQYTASLGNRQYLIELDGHLSSSYRSTSSFSDDLNLVRNEFSSSYSQLSTSAPELIYKESDIPLHEDIVSNDDDTLLPIPMSPLHTSIWLRDLKDKEAKWIGTENIDKSGSWTNSRSSNYFPKLKQMISNLPFKGMGRAHLMISETGTPTLTHQDYEMSKENFDVNYRPECIWIDILGNKKLYIANQSDTINWYLNDFDDNLLTKTYVTGSTCWLDASYAHGTNASNGLSATIRIDGEFTAEFRQKIFNDDQ